jgi:hypothetical protein
MVYFKEHSMLFILLLILIAFITYLIRSIKADRKREEEKYKQLIIDISGAETLNQWSSCYHACINFLSRCSHPSRNTWDNTLLDLMNIQRKWIDHANKIEQY